MYSDRELQALARAAERTDQRVAEEARLLIELRDMRARQLSVLRTTYPAWNITCERDPSGQTSWTAALLRPVTPEMVAAGVMSPLRREDPIALAATLAWQSGILHCYRSRYVPSSQENLEPR